MRQHLGLAAVAMMLGCGQSYAENFGNVVVAADQSTNCAQLAPPSGAFFGISVTSYASSSSATSYWISFPAIVKGFVQPQYIVLRLNKTGSATSGTAQVFNNSFLGGSIAGTWAGDFSIDSFADFVINKVTFTATSASCNFTLTNGLAIFAGN